MNGSICVDLGRDALWLVVTLSLIPVGVAFVVSFVASVFQAATQLNEQTLALAPKLITVFLSLLLCGAFLASTLVHRAEAWWAQICQVGG